MGIRLMHHADFWEAWRHGMTRFGHGRSLAKA